MRSLAFLTAAVVALLAAPLAAQEVVYDDQVVVVDDGANPTGSGSERFVSAGDVQSIRGDIPRGVAAFGPFRVLDASRAAMVDVTDAGSPLAFQAMMRAFPGIAMIEMVDCPGTEDDLANLRLGRLIRASGITTYVPPGGSVRSGGVEIFLAGARRMAAPQAEFAVHAWMDDTGHEANDYAASDPENAKYIAYYEAMGMTADQARGFYAMTNSVPHAQALWLTGIDMARWVALDDTA